MFKSLFYHRWTLLKMGFNCCQEHIHWTALILWFSIIWQTISSLRRYNHVNSMVCALNHPTLMIIVIPCLVLKAQPFNVCMENAGTGSWWLSHCCCSCLFRTWKNNVNISRLSFQASSSRILAYLGPLLALVQLLSTKMVHFYDKSMKLCVAF